MAPNDGTSGAQGTTYEARMCMLLFVRGYIRGMKGFKLEYQVSDADKFDDIVFDGGSGEYEIVQLKHKEHEGQWKITHSNLFTEKFNNDFNLIKYVKAFVNANSTKRFKDKINDAIVVTNIDFDLKDGELSFIVNQRPTPKAWYDGLKSIELKPTTLNPSAIFDMSNVDPGAKYYKFIDDQNIVQILKRQAQTLSREVGSVTEDEIREALDKLIYAVKQPNVTKIKEIIKEEIKDYFKLYNADSIYEKLETLFRDWCDTKNRFEQPSTSAESNVSQQHVLTFADADKIFQNHVKPISFEVTAPTDAFTGRVQELEEIRRKLIEESNLIVSSTLTISGLGGIGKTQLTKQFIKQFGKSDFFGRVIWIEAQRDETIKNSFRRLAQLLKFQDVYYKNIKVIIQEVFQYFEGLKVLFVFDNFDKSAECEGDLVTYCWRTVSSSVKSGRPYFLFTSRNRNCLPGVPLLDLNVLSLKEAVQLIIKELKEVSPTEADAKKLAEYLHYFPLALRQAIAYIKEQHAMKQLFGERFKIQDYFTKFDEETKALLDFEFPGDFGKNEKTTFITWNVTLDAIKTEKLHGKNAIQALKIFAYLYPDKISPNIFLTLFNNDDEKTAKALLLLEKFSMITKIQQKKNSFYQIHRLVQSVVQLKFQNESRATQEQTLELMNPELYKEYFGNWFKKLLNRQNVQELVNKCSADQIIHYNTLSVHMQKHEALMRKYKDFFSELNDKVLKEAAFDNDVEKLKAIKVTNEKLRSFIDQHLESLLRRKSNKVIIYFIEIGALGINDRFQNKPLIKLLIELTERFSLAEVNDNLELFKFLIEKGANLSEVLEFTSVQLISEIIKGKTILIQKLFRGNPKNYQAILIECLFFATIFKQESILLILCQNIVKPNLQYKNLSFIDVAINLKLNNIHPILLQISDKNQLEKYFIYLGKEKNFTDKKVFKIIWKKYLKKGGDANYLNKILHESLWSSRDFDTERLNLAHFMLDNGADLDSIPMEAVLNLLVKYEHDCWRINDKHRFEELLNRIFLHDFRSKDFEVFAVHTMLRINDLSSNEYSRTLFEKLLQKTGGINVSFSESETLLIFYLKDKHFRFHKFDTVKYLVEHGVDVEAQDDEGNSALYYASKKNELEIFNYLLDHVKSVDENVLEVTIKEDNKELVQKLLEKHFTADFCFANGKTLIEVAVERVSARIVLLSEDDFKKYHERGGDVNKRDKEGQTILIKIIQEIKLNGRYDGDFVDVKFLVENGLNVDIRDNDKYSALYYAAMSHLKDIFLYLLENSRSVDEEALHRAITWKILSKIEDLPPNFNKDQILKIKTRLIDIASERSKDCIIDFLNQLEIEKIKELFNDLCEAVKQDEVEKLKAIKISTNNLNEMKKNFSEVIKSAIENDFLKINDRMTVKSLAEWSIVCCNFELFKFLIEKGATLSDVLELASFELISEIII